MSFRVNNNESREISELILAHLDGRISDDEFADLESRLENNPAARREYANLSRIDAGLRDSGNLPEAEITFPEKRSKIIAFRSILPLAAAACLVLGFVGWIFPKSGDSIHRSGSFVASDHPERRVSGVAVVTAQSKAAWGEMVRVAIRDGDSLEPGELVLNSGLVQIEFFGGASISLSGPAKLELLSRNQAVLHSGRLRAVVPPAARGFEILTGDIRIEDLGTSFGLAVEESGDADVVVFDGEIRATGEDGEAVALYGGEAANLANRKTVVKVAPSGYAFPEIEDVFAGAHHRSDSRYAGWKEASLELRNDSRLVAYYDFENLTPTSRRLKNRVPGDGAAELDGGIVGARVAEGRWSGKTALDFRQEGDRVRFAIPGTFPNLTLFVWVRIDALDRHLNSLFLTDYYDEREFHWQLSSLGALHFASSPRGVIDLDKHNRRFYSEQFWTPEKSGQWFNLATTVDRENGSLTHYVNGRAVGFSGGTHMENPLPEMRIGKADLGNWSDPIWPDAPIRTLNGRIDEFAIFREALSAKEIEELYENGKP